MPKLSELDPKQVEVVSAPARAAAPRLSDLDPAQVEIVSQPEPPKPEMGAVESAVRTVAGGIAATVDGGAGADSIAARVPIIGPLGRQLGERFRAAAESVYTADPEHEGKSYDEILASIQARRAAANARFAEEHPGANVARTLVGAVGGGAAIPIPGAAAPVLGPALKTGAPVIGAAGGSALARVAGTAGLAAADKALDTGNVDDVKQAATLAGGLQAGVELLPIVGKPLKPLVQPAKDALTRAVGTLGGVAPKNIRAYLADPDAVRAARETADIVGQAEQATGRIVRDAAEARALKVQAQEALARLDETVTAGLKGTREKIAARLADSKKALKQSFIGRLEGLRKKAVPLEAADEIVGLLRNEKAVLGSLSEQADDALARSGQAFEKEHVLELFDQVGRSLGVGQRGTLISDEAVGAAKRLADQRQRVADGFDAEISSEDLRGILKQMRADINWNRNAAEFNDALNGARKAFTHRVSGVLKDKIPEYSALMGRMAQLSQSLDDMGRYFGTREQALASLEAVATGKGPRATVLGDVLRTYSKATGNERLVGQLGDVADARRVLGSPTAQEGLRRGLPEAREVGRAEAALAGYSPARIDAARRATVDTSAEKAALEAATTADAAARAQADKFGWAPRTIESRFKQAMGGRSAVAEREVAELSQATGIDFTEMLKNRAVADAFDKGYMHGSRNVNLWSIIGGLFGGQAIRSETARTGGALLGGLIDTAGPKMTQKALDAFMALRDSRYLLALERAAKDGRAALTATHVALMREPEYRKIFENQTQADAMRRRAAAQGGK